MLVAAHNPCPCGYLGDRERPCTCLPGQVAKYSKKLSGPIIDRIDLHVEVPRLKFDKLTEEKVAESSSEVRAKIEAVRKIGQERYAGLPYSTNAEIPAQDIKRFCPVDQTTQDLLRNAVDRMHLSARAYHRILKLARTIADVENSAPIQMTHVAEAIQYRQKSE